MGDNNSSIFLTYSCCVDWCLVDSKVVPLGKGSEHCRLNLASAFLLYVNDLIFKDRCILICIRRGSTTVTLTGTSSLEPSGYVTTTGYLFHQLLLYQLVSCTQNVVPFGSLGNANWTLASGVSTTLTVWSLAVMFYPHCAWILTVTLTVLHPLRTVPDKDNNCCVLFTSCCCILPVSVLNVLGRSETLPIEPLASGVSASMLTVWSLVSRCILIRISVRGINHSYL